MQENLKKYMENSENPKGTNIINNLTSTKYLFLERNELIEVPLKAV